MESKCEGRPSTPIDVVMAADSSLPALHLAKEHRTPGVAQGTVPPKLKLVLKSCVNITLREKVERCSQCAFSSECEIINEGEKP